MLIPDAPKQHNDLVDVVIQAAQRLKEITNTKTGEVQIQEYIDSKIIWWKTQIIAKPSFGRYAKLHMDFEALAFQADDFMTPLRAATLRKQILAETEGYERSIDATSSISRLDKNNTQLTLVDRINSSKVPKYYSLKEETKKGLAEALFGGRKKEEEV